MKDVGLKPLYFILENERRFKVLARSFCNKDTTLKCLKFSHLNIRNVYN